MSYLNRKKMKEREREMKGGEKERDVDFNNGTKKCKFKYGDLYYYISPYISSYL